jgi:hypothetical protein
MVLNGKREGITETRDPGMEHNTVRGVPESKK